MDKVPANDPVAGLIDIPLPAPTSLWPQTWPSQIFVAVLILALIAAICWSARRWCANRYRRAALAELDQILRARGAKTTALTSDALASLVRRTALAVFPREAIAPLSGSAWLAFLDRSYGGDEFSHGTGRLLGIAPYAPQPAAAVNVSPLADLVRRWIRTHHA